MEHANHSTRWRGTRRRARRTWETARFPKTGGHDGACPASALLVLLALLLGVANARAAETGAFWVWNRDAPLTAAEAAALRAGGVSRLYWHVGELVARPGGALAWRSRLAPPPAPPGLEIIPTVRLATELRSPELFTADALADALAGAAVHGRVQADYDCPDRLVPAYAGRLRAARATGNVPWLSVTALTGWVDKPGFAGLKAAADELCPMFYDLDPDPFAPLLDPGDTARRLAAWGRGCAGKPWLAGLPAFARVTFVGAGGAGRGHLRAWRWEELFLQPGLRPEPGDARAGSRLMVADRPVRLGGRSIPAGQRLVVRSPDPAALRGAVAAARAAGAVAVAFFRLPEPGGEAAPDGPSLGATLSALAPEKPPAPAQPRLRREENGALALANLSPDADLPPQPGGWALEVECGEGARGAWREALAGDFWRAEPAGAPGGPIGLATRVTFWFARLPAGGTLRTGLVQLAPGASPAALRWRVPQLGDSWQPVEPSSSP